MLYSKIENYNLEQNIFKQEAEAMAVSYNKLFKLLIDKKMKKKELCELAGVSASTVGKMGRGEPVSVEMVEKVCLALECTPNDVLEFYRNDKRQ